MGFNELKYCTSCQRRRSRAQFPTPESTVCATCLGKKKPVSEHAVKRALGTGFVPKSSTLDKTSKL